MRDSRALLRHASQDWSVYDAEVQLEEMKRRTLSLKLGVFKQTVHLG